MSTICLYVIRKVAGLPNITGWFALRNTADYGSDTRAFYTTTAQDASHIACALGAQATSYTRVNLNLARSNAIYGKSSTVAPLSLSCKFAIRY